MSEGRRERMRGTLPENYQFGDAEILARELELSLLLQPRRMDVLFGAACPPTPCYIGTRDDIELLFVTPVNEWPREAFGESR